MRLWQPPCSFMKPIFSRLTLPILCICLLTPALHLQAAEHWIRVSTSHFEMYTSNSEKQAVNALQTFEEVRSFFLQASHSKAAQEQPVRIIAFNSEKEYKPYRLNAGAFAYYLRSRERDYIVMQDISPDHYGTAVHEYTHLVVEHQHLQLPIWLNEGLADVYSSLEPHGKQAMVGRPLPGRFYVLQSEPWMDWNTLFAVDQRSPYYNESNKMSIFYAQSWALTHMLLLDDRYRIDFPRFFAAVSGGTPGATAFQSVYGKSVKQVDKDLRAYLRQSSVHVSLFDVNLQKSDLDPQVTDLSDLQLRLALGDLLAGNQSTMGEAQNRLSQLDKEYPGNADVEESLGYLAWQEGKLADAQAYFARSIQNHANDAHMIYQYAGMRSSAGAAPAELMPLLEQVIALEPDNNDARLFLGVTATSNRQFGFALSTLSEIKTIKPDQAYEYFSALAFCDMNLKNPVAAKNNAQKALSYATSVTEKDQANKLLRYLEQNTKQAH